MHEDDIRQRVTLLFSCMALRVQGVKKDIIKPYEPHITKDEVLHNDYGLLQDGGGCG